MPTNKKPLLNLEDYPEILTKKELAEFLRISEKTLLNRRADENALPPAFSTTRLTFARDDVRAWVDGKIVSRHHA